MPEDESKPPPFPEFMDPDRTAVQRYWERVVFTFNHLHNLKTEPPMKAMLTAFCIHATQSVTEALGNLAEDRKDDNLKAALDALEFAQLLEHVRNHDLHGNPIPVCDDKANFVISTSGKKPMTLTSSHGVGVQVQMHGAKPKARLSKKDQKHGKFSPGDAISFQCSDGILGVYDASSSKTYDLLRLLERHLKALHKIIAPLFASSEAEAEEPPPA